MAAIPYVRMICEGCGHEIPPETLLPFRCPRSADLPTVDHMLLRHLDLANSGLASAFDDGETNPFLRYRHGLYPYWIGQAHDESEESFAALVHRLEQSVRAVDGVGFQATALHEIDGLLDSLPAVRLWIKDESNNVSGSHKARHLMGIQLWLETIRRLDWMPEPGSKRRDLAIASCGNAALAAAVIAHASKQRLRVFVPVDAEPAIVNRLRSLGAIVESCPRKPGVRGDPCMHGFREAVDQGAIPYGCQGTENGLTLEGGRTLGYEFADQLRRRSASLDHLIVQVGGGALAASLSLSLAETVAMGVTSRMPRFHTVQTSSAYPLYRAWSRIADQLLGIESSTPRAPNPRADLTRAAAVAQLPAAKRVAGLRYAATHRDEFMWAWETTPRSLASGILDDETYDWLPVLGSMLETGGIPLVASELLLARAHALAHERTPIAVCPTGSAGLAGFLELARHDLISSGEQVGLVFSGHQR